MHDCNSAAVIKNRTALIVLVFIVVVFVVNNKIKQSVFERAQKKVQTQIVTTRPTTAQYTPKKAHTLWDVSPSVYILFFLLQGGSLVVNKNNQYVLP